MPEWVEGLGAVSAFVSAVGVLVLGLAHARLAGRVEDLAGRVEDLAGRVEDLAGRVENLAGRVEKLAGRLDEIGRQQGQILAALVRR